MSHLGKYEYYGLVVKDSVGNEFLHDIYDTYESAVTGRNLLECSNSEIYGLRSVFKLNTTHSENDVVFGYGVESTTHCVKLLNTIQYILNSIFLSKDIKLFCFANYGNATEYFLGKLIAQDSETTECNESLSVKTPYELSKAVVEAVKEIYKDVDVTKDHDKFISLCTAVVKNIIKSDENNQQLEKSRAKRRNRETLELELLEYRKFMNETENREFKDEEEREIAEWLGQPSYTIEPLTEEEEKRLETLKKLYT